jgi:hypothetical protein
MNPAPRSIRPALKSLDAGGATRPRASFQVNGDAFLLWRFEGGMLVAVIDGLGHGERARRASEVAVRYLEAHGGDSLDSLFTGVAQVCRATDGVVMAAARFEFGNAITFSFASVGNIEARMSSPLAQERLVVRRGILGANAAQPRVTHHIWNPGSILVLHSDGVAANWRWEDFRAGDRETSGAMAQFMLDRLAKDEDDATVVVVREGNGEAGGR